MHNEAYGLPVANHPDEVLSNCITEIFEYFYEEGFGGVEQSDFTRLQEEAGMADELVFVVARWSTPCLNCPKLHLRR